VTFARFFKAANKAKDYYLLSSRSAVAADSQGINTREDYFFIKCDYKYERIQFNDILYVQALQNYVTIHTIRGKYMTLLHLKNVEENLDGQSFIKVHKSYIVSIAKIDAIEHNDIIIEGSRIPISRNFREAVIERVVNNKLWRKPNGAL
jgi:two-component system, LytTR family, response regulator